MSFYANDIALHNDSIVFAQLCHSNSSKNSIDTWTDKYTDQLGFLLKSQNENGKNSKNGLEEIDINSLGEEIMSISFIQDLKVH